MVTSGKVIVVKEITEKNVGEVLAKIKHDKKRAPDVVRKLKRGLDGLDYQRSVRNEWT